MALLLGYSGTHLFTGFPTTDVEVVVGFGFLIFVCSPVDYLQSDSYSAMSSYK
jgi:hypothetical protein